MTRWAPIKANINLASRRFIYPLRSLSLTVEFSCGISLLAGEFVDLVPIITNKVLLPN